MGELILVRHGHTPLNVPGRDERLRGWLDIPLDDQGLQEAAEDGRPAGGLSGSGYLLFRPSPGTADRRSASPANSCPRDTCNRIAPVEFGCVLRPAGSRHSSFSQSPEPTSGSGCTLAANRSISSTAAIRAALSNSWIWRWRQRDASWRSPMFGISWPHKPSLSTATATAFQFVVVCRPERSPSLKESTASGKCVRAPTIPNRFHRSRPSPRFGCDFPGTTSKDLRHKRHARPCHGSRAAIRRQHVAVRIIVTVCPLE